MKTILKYLKPFVPRMSVQLIIKFLGTVCELMLPFILSHILSNVMGKSISVIIGWGIIMLIFSALACVLNIIANRMAARVSSDFAENMRKDLFLKTLKLSAAQTDSFTIPSLESRITSDTYNVHSFVNMAQRMGVRAPIIVFGGIAITLFMDAYLSLVMIAILPVIFGVVYFVSRKGVPLYSRVQKSVDSMVRVVREDSVGIRVIKALSRSSYEHSRYDEVNRALVKNEIRAGTIMSTVNPVMTMLMNLGIVAVIAISASRIHNGLSKPETVIAFMQYFTLISMSMMFLTRMFVMYTKCAASAERISEVLNTPEGMTLKAEEEFPPESTDAHILFKDVSFSYKGKKNNVDGISFEVKKGGSLGIIGATGSGKSTLIRLLLRFYDVTAGGIYINGRDIRTIESEELYSYFGFALQYDFLFADTVEENIAFGRDISREALKNASEIAQADDFISRFADGYSHKLSPHGTNISGGQKQRILISRALASDPSILILDDSSSALDYKTDAALRKALREKSKTTTVTVAQRVSTVKDCDLILVLDEGKIIGAGTHEELISSCGIYKEISDSQMGGAFVD